MCSCDQSLVTVEFVWEKLSRPQFYKELTRKTAFFEAWYWFRFNNLGLALGTNLKFYTSVAKRSKLKVRKFWELIPTFVEVTGEKLVGGGLFTPPPILNRVNTEIWKRKTCYKFPGGFDWGILCCITFLLSTAPFKGYAWIKWHMIQ